MAMAVILSGCIYEDLTECPAPASGVRLIVKTAAEVNNATDFDRYGIDSVTVYVFDRAGRFVTLSGGGPYTIGREYALPVTLPGGSYQFVAFTNQGDFYQTNWSKEALYAAKPLIGDISMSVNLPGDRCVRNDIPNLHYGTLQDAEVVKDRDNVFTVVVTPDTYKVNFTVKGLPLNNDQYDFSVEDHNFSRRMNNARIPLTGDFYYVRTSDFIHRTDLTTSMIILDLAETKIMPFTLTNDMTQRVMYSDNLIGMIRKAYQNAGQALDFGTTFEFDIVLSFQANLGIGVSVNGWSYSGNESNL